MQNNNDDAPESLDLNNSDKSWIIWTWMEATDWRFLPSQLMNEPEWLMQDLFTISAEKRRIEELLDGK